MILHTLVEAREKLEDLAEKTAAGVDAWIATRSGVQLRLVPVEASKELPPRQSGSAKGTRILQVIAAPRARVNVRNERDE